MMAGVSERLSLIVGAASAANSCSLRKASSRLKPLLRINAECLSVSMTGFLAQDNRGFNP